LVVEAERSLRSRSHVGHTRKITRKIDRSTGDEVTINSKSRQTQTHFGTSVRKWQFSCLADPPYTKQLYDNATVSEATHDDDEE